VAGDQTPDAFGLRALHVPALVEQLQHLAETMTGKQEVVALGEYQRHFRYHADRIGHCLLSAAVESGSSDQLVRSLPAQTAQELAVTRGIEGVGRSLALPTAPPLQLRVRKMESVQRDADSPAVQVGDQALGQM